MTQHYAMPTVADISKLMADAVRDVGDQIDAAIGTSGVGEAANTILSGTYDDIAIAMRRAMTGKAIRVYDSDFNLVHILDMADCVNRGHCTFTLPADHPVAQWLWKAQTDHGPDAIAAMPTEGGEWLGRLREMLIEEQRDGCACHAQRVLVTRWERCQPNFRVLAAQHPNGSWRVFHPATRLVVDFVNRDDIKFQMARLISRKTGAPLGDMHVLLDVVSLDVLAAIENA